MTDEDACRALMWLRVLLNGESDPAAGFALAPVMAKLEEQVGVRMMWRLSGVKLTNA